MTEQLDRDHWIVTARPVQVVAEPRLNVPPTMSSMAILPVTAQVRACSDGHYYHAERLCLLRGHNLWFVL